MELRSRSTPPTLERNTSSPHGNNQDGLSTNNETSAQKTYEEQQYPAAPVLNNDFRHCRGGQQMSSYMKPVQPTFDGSNYSWEAFLMQLRLLAKTYKWTEEDFHTQLILSIKGRALTFIASLQGGVQDNTFALLGALERRYGKNKHAETQRATLSSLRKHSRESWQEYSARVDELMSEAYPGMHGTDIYSGLAIEYFLRGIPDRKLAYEVQLRKPTDLTETVEIVMWHEACRQSSFRGSDVHLVETGEEPETASDTEMPSVRCPRRQRKSRSDRHKRDMRRVDDPSTMEEKLKKLYEKFGALMGYGKEKLRENQTQRNQKRGPICFTCNKPGHKSPECPEKPKLSRNTNKGNSSTLMRVQYSPAVLRTLRTTRSCLDLPEPGLMPRRPDDPTDQMMPRGPDEPPDEGPCSM